MGERNELIGLLDAAGRAHEYASGQLLCVEHETGTDAFVVRSGTVEAFISRPEGELVVATHSAGALIGEVTAVIGGRRTASLRAIDAVTVAVVDSEALSAGFERFPQLGAAVLVDARERTDRTRVAALLASALNAYDDEAIAAIAKQVSWQTLLAGETLFSEGDEADAAYLLVSGRLRVANDAGDHLAELGRGEIVGEFGLIEGRARSATVTAMRDTRLARLGSEDFAELNANHTGLAMGLVRRVLDRTADRLDKSNRAARSVGLVVLDPTCRWAVGDTFHAALADLGSALHLSVGRVDTMLNQPGMANTDPAGFGDVRLAELFHYAESNYEQILLESDAGESRWTDRVLRQADQVVIACPAHLNSADDALLARVLDRVPDEVPVWLMLLHPATTPRPAGTASVLERHPVDEAHHVANGSRTDIARIARLAAGKGYGLVLGGGGARGYAHVGVIRSLEDHGIPIDRVVGASMGAVIAGGYAQGVARDERANTLKRQMADLLDYTVPIVSIIKAERIAKSVEAQFGGWDLEDMWTPFTCVSTNLTTSAVLVHRRGSATQAVRASLSLPGIMPPVAFAGDLLVDGGILNNLPVDVMADDPSISTIIACDVTPPFGPRAKIDHGLSMSGWKALRAKVGRGDDPYPGLGAVLMRSMLLGSTRDRDRHVASGQIDLYLDLDLAGVGLLDFEVVDPVVEKGYEAADPRIAKWIVERDAATANLKGSIS